MLIYKLHNPPVPHGQFHQLHHLPAWLVPLTYQDIILDVKERFPYLQVICPCLKSKMKHCSSVEPNVNTHTKSRLFLMTTTSKLSYVMYTMPWCSSTIKTVLLLMSEKYTHWSTCACIWRLSMLIGDLMLCDRHIPSQSTLELGMLATTVSCISRSQAQRGIAQISFTSGGIPTQDPCQMSGSVPSR